MAKILVAMDSRGMEFENILQQVLVKKLIQVEVKILAIRGANLETMEAKALSELSTCTYDQAYIMLGINNVTKRFFQKQIVLAFENIPELVDTLDDMFTNLKIKLQTKVQKVIVCHLVGLNILTYNIAKKGRVPLLVADYPAMQRTINESIPLINRAIDSMNVIKPHWTMD